MIQKQFQKKYNLHSNNVLSLFALSSTFKKNKALKDLRNIKIRNLNMLNLPSAYCLNLTKNMQNPKVIIYYSKVLNFNKLAFLNELHTTCFKLKLFWYAQFLLKECLHYKNSQTLTSALTLNLRRFNVKTAYLLKNGSLVLNNN